MEIVFGLFFCDKIVFFLVDVITEHLLEYCNFILERVVGFVDSDKYVSCI